MSREIILFANGTMAVLHDGEQQTELQTPWLELVARFLRDQGKHPMTYRLTLPDGKTASFFFAGLRWNWKIE